MTARLLDGKSLAAQVRATVKQEVAALARRGVTPGLAVVLVGENPASRVYVRNKTRACEETGVRSTQIDYPASVTEAELLRRIHALNEDPAVHGILVQLPLPAAIDSFKVLRAVSPAKDVDGFHPENLGALLQGAPRFVPCTPAGIMRLLDHAGVRIDGRRAVVIGRSSIVGKPVSLLLLQRNATVTICHSKSTNIEMETRDADIL